MIGKVKKTRFRITTNFVFVGRNVLQGNKKMWLNAPTFNISVKLYKIKLHLTKIKCILAGTEL